MLRRNDFVALVGPEGAGKSSVISAILGECARMALTLMTLKRTNLLVLDEPDLK